MFSMALNLAREAAVAKHASPFSPSSSSSSSSHAGNGPSGTPSFAISGRGGQVAPTRIWDCLAAAASGDVKALLESEGGGGGGGGLLERIAASTGARKPVPERVGGTGGEAAGALDCKRLLVEAGAFERFGYSELSAAFARSALQVLSYIRVRTYVCVCM